MDERLMEIKDADRADRDTYNRPDPFSLSSGRMILCFTSYHNRIARGYLKTIYFEKTFYFCGLDHLLFIMDDIMDGVNRPQRTSCYRNIRGQKFRMQSDIFRKEENTDKVSVFEDAEDYGQELDKKMITIEVYCRRNASIQGQLKLPCGKVFFRSGMELMRLLHEYLEKASG